MTSQEVLNNPEVGDRGISFKRAIDLFVASDGKFIVETGCIRWNGDLASGGSTLIFGLIAQEYNVQFDSIDYEVASIKAAKEMVGDLPVIFHNWDSVETLKEWPNRIDLLYLDSLGSSSEPVLAQEHQLAEIEAAYDKLSEKAVVLLDDNKQANGGKTVLSKKFLIDKGWTVLIDDTQCLLVRGSNG